MYTIPVLATDTTLGFATVSANSGHNGISGEPFYQRTGVLEDLAWHSVHTGAGIGNELVSLFHDKTHTKSYYMGCLTGGRQGFKSALEFLYDFDGIVTSAPAFDLDVLLGWGG